MMLFYIVVTYVVLVWVVARLIVPNLGFSKQSLPDVLPEALNATISRLNTIATTDRDFLVRAYDYVTSTYTGSRLKTLTQCWRAFGNPYQKSPGFLPCTVQNYILRTILVKSGRFSEHEIQIQTVPLNLFIHQYLNVYVDGTWIAVDPWSHFLGIPLGKHSAFVG